MIFVYRTWDDFCRKLKEANIHSVSAQEVLAHQVEEPWFVLKHDVETDVSRAYRMASIEQSYGHRGSYYVQAYLLQNESNVRMLQAMQNMGHEVSYHYDVLDSNNGDMEKALAEFEGNRCLFEENGFTIKTVCQHGNPVVVRNGYHSNRDFFRSAMTQARYPALADIMVDFKTKSGFDYLYFSDAGRRFHLVYDPINNDVVNSEAQNVPCENLDQLRSMLDGQGNCIVSTHPHRWSNSAAVYMLKLCIFKTVRFTAKKLMAIEPVKKLMGRYYYLAKKF